MSDYFLLEKNELFSLFLFVPPRDAKGPHMRGPETISSHARTQGAVPSGASSDRDETALAPWPCQQSFQIREC